MFVHLRLHTEFSVVDGTNRIDETVKVAAADHQPALAITDLNNLFGAIKFYKEARGAGVKPIIGAEIVLQGLGNDTSVLSRMVALELASIFPHRFYLEVQRAGRPDDEAHVAAAVQLAARLKLPVVATHPVQFTQADDYEAHEARVCIAEGEILGNQRRVRKFTHEQYFKSQAAMEQLFADLPSAVANTLEIAKRCNLVLELGKPHLPDYPTPEKDGRRMPIEEYFRFASHEGLKQRL